MKSSVAPVATSISPALVTGSSVLMVSVPPVTSMMPEALSTMMGAAVPEPIWLNPDEKMVLPSFSRVSNGSPVTPLYRAVGQGHLAVAAECDGRRRDFAGLSSWKALLASTTIVPVFAIGE